MLYVDVDPRLKIVTIVTGATFTSTTVTANNNLDTTQGTLLVPEDQLVAVADVNNLATDGLRCRGGAVDKDRPRYPK